jgi:hypothetical protein
LILPFHLFPKKVFGSTGTLPVQRTGWKPGPPAFSCFRGESLVYEELPGKVQSSRFIRVRTVHHDVLILLEVFAKQELGGQVVPKPELGNQA